MNDVNYDLLDSRIGATGELLYHTVPETFSLADRILCVSALLSRLIQRAVPEEDVSIIAKKYDLIKDGAIAVCESEGWESTPST